MKVTKQVFSPTAFVRQVFSDIKTEEKKLKAKEKEFRKEWNKWGKPNPKQD